MFTGLIQDIGTLVETRPHTAGKELKIRTKLASEIKVDDSIATNGICLTATTVGADFFICQAVHVTLEKTTAGLWGPGEKLNLELSLRHSDRLGGHFVQGHVNALTKIQEIQVRGGNWEVTMDLPQDLKRYMISEGSITLDGVSLTIARLTEKSFTVSMIPHTLERTHFSTKKRGDLINLEVDLIAKYIESLLGPQKASSDERFKSLLGVKS